MFELINQHTNTLKVKSHNDYCGLSVIDGCLLVLYRCIQHNVVNKSVLNDKILSLEHQLEYLDGKCCIGYIRLVKYGLGLSPSEKVFQMAESKTTNPRDKNALKFYKRPIDIK